MKDRKQNSKTKNMEFLVRICIVYCNTQRKTEYMNIKMSDRRIVDARNSIKRATGVKILDPHICFI